MEHRNLEADWFFWADFVDGDVIYVDILKVREVIVCHTNTTSDNSTFSIQINPGAGPGLCSNFKLSYLGKNFLQD